MSPIEWLDLARLAYPGVRMPKILIGAYYGHWYGRDFDYGYWFGSGPGHPASSGPGPSIRFTLVLSGRAEISPKRLRARERVHPRMSYRA